MLKCITPGFPCRDVQNFLHKVETQKLMQSDKHKKVNKPKMERGLMKMIRDNFTD